jgi:hypothetical protein
MVRMLIIRSIVRSCLLTEHSLNPEALDPVPLNMMNIPVCSKCAF